MKGHQIVITISAFLVIAAALFSLLYFTSRVPNSPSNVTGGKNITESQQQDNFTSKPASSQENSEIASSEPIVNVYTVKEYAGHIGVFLDSETEPVQEIDVPVDSLPASDRALLAKGITVDGEIALRSLLEDYES